MKKISILLSLFLITSCTKSEPPKPLKKYDSVKILLIVAPWCDPCHKELPEFDRLTVGVDKLFIEAKTQTGLKPQSVPDVETANEMKRLSNVSFDITPDESKWFSYKKYVGDKEYLLPVSVVIGETETCNGEVCGVEEETVKVFRGKEVPSEVVAMARASIK